MNHPLRVMTYNIHKAIGGVDRKYAPERIVEVIGEARPDIALLQEVDDNVSRSNFDRQVDFLREALGYDHSAFQQNVKVKQGGYGNAILSRFPIKTTWHLDLTVPLKKRRQALVVKVQLPSESGSLFVCNTHLGLAGMERKAQVRKLLAHETVTHLRPEVPVIVAGDLNDVWSSLSKKMMQPSEFSNASQYTKTFPARMPIRALDGIYYRGALNLANCIAFDSAVARQASDHLPLVANFEVAASSWDLSPQP